MPIKTYVGNSPRTAQVDMIVIERDQYLSGKIAEGSRLICTINDKTVEAVVPYRESSLTDQTGPWEAIRDSEAAKALLLDLQSKWNSSQNPEFREIKCSAPLQNDNQDWYVTLTAVVPGVPFAVTVEAPYPVVDVDTVRQGAAGTNASWKFWISSVAVGGVFFVRWDVGNGQEVSSPITFPATAEAVRVAIVAGMSSVLDGDITVTGSGTSDAPYVIAVTAEGSLAQVATSNPSVDVTNLTGGGEVYVATVRNGGEGALYDPFTDTLGTLLTSHVSGDGTGWEEADLTEGRAYIYGPNQLHLSPWGTGSKQGRWMSLYDDNPDGTVDFYVKQWSPSTGTINPSVIQAIARYEDYENYIEARLEFDKDYYGTASVAGDPIGRVILVLNDRTTGPVITEIDRVECDDIPLGILSSYGGSLEPFYDFTVNLRLSLTVNGTSVSATVTNVSSGISHTISGSAAADSGIAKFGVGYEVLDGSDFVIDDFRIADGSTTNEIQGVWLKDGANGEFTLTKPGGATSSGLSVSSSVSDLTTAMEAVYGSGNIQCTGGSGTEGDPWLFEFIGTNAGDDVPQMTGDGSSLTGYAGAEVVVTDPGSPGVSEQWSVSIHDTTDGTFRVAFRGKETIDIDYGSAASVVQEAMEDLPNIGAGQVTVTGDGTPEDPYIVTLGTNWLAKDVRQLVVLPDDLVGTGLPEFEHFTYVESDGPWHWDRSRNWFDPENETYGVPQNGDTVVIEAGDMNRCLKYGLPEGWTLTLAGLYINGAFTSGAVMGLPRWNPLGYKEYRRCAPQIAFDSGTPSVPTPVVIGDRGGPGSACIKIEVDDSLIDVRVYVTTAPISGEIGAVQIVCPNEDATYAIHNGFLSIAPYAGQVSAVKKLEQFGGSVTIGHGCTVQDIHKTSGTLFMDRVTASGVVNIQG